MANRSLLALLALFLFACGLDGHSDTSRNKEVVRLQHEEVWSKGNLAMIDAIYTADFVCHFVVGPEWHGREGVAAAVRAHRTSFPDWTERVEDVVAEGDRVVTRFTSSGTQLGEFQGVRATGRRVVISEVAVYRFAGGKIAEQWGFPDVLSLQRQLAEAGVK